MSELIGTCTVVHENETERYSHFSLKLTENKLKAQSVSNVEVISTNFYSQILWKYDVPIVRESLITCLTLIVH